MASCSSIDLNQHSSNAEIATSKHYCIVIQILLYRVAQPFFLSSYLIVTFKIISYFQFLRLIYIWIFIFIHFFHFFHFFYYYKSIIINYLINYCVIIIINLLILLSIIYLFNSIINYLINYCVIIIINLLICYYWFIDSLLFIYFINLLLLISYYQLFN